MIINECLWREDSQNDNKTKKAANVKRPPIKDNQNPHLEIQWNRLRCLLCKLIQKKLLFVKKTHWFYFNYLLFISYTELWKNTTNNFLWRWTQNCGFWLSISFSWFCVPLCSSFWWVTFGSNTNQTPPGRNSNNVFILGVID